MMTPRDYLNDAKDIILRRYSYRGSELDYLVGKLRRQPRCYLGLHYPQFYADLGQSYYEPGEPGWACGWCEKEPCYRLPDRLLVWFEETRIGQWYVYTFLSWKDTLLGRTCREHHCLRPCQLCEEVA
jgi:hypothetical protein